MAIFRVSPIRVLLAGFAFAAATTAIGAVNPAFAAAATATASANVMSRPAVTMRQVDHRLSAPLGELAGLAPSKASRFAQKTSPAAAPGVPQTLESFDGLGGANGYSDPNIGVGSTQIVEMVNWSVTVYDKTGTPQIATLNDDVLWSGMSGPCGSSGNNHVDPIVRYDALAGRWVLSLVGANDPAHLYNECVAVSTTSDARSAYNVYAFDQFSPYLPDYPKLGVWPDAYYLTVKYINGPRACALNRAAMLSGQAATMQCADTFSSDHVLLPSDVDGTTPPPAGEPNTLLSLDNSANNILHVWKFHVDWTTPANSTFPRVPASVAVAPYSSSCSACSPQPGTTTLLDGNNDTLMYRVAYRNFGGHESLVATHAVAVSSSALGMRWYELRFRADGTTYLYQQGTWSPDSTSRFQGAVAMDKAGNMGLAYTATSSTLYPSIRFTGRGTLDPMGQMTQGEGTIVTGAGSQTTSSRWDDYSSLDIDPVDGCTFWYVNAYLTANTTGSNNPLQTRIGSFQMPGCAITNPGFETGDLTGWANFGSATASATFPHSGTYDARLPGNTTIAQQFKAPYGASRLSFWWHGVCPQWVAGDGGSASLWNVTTGTITPLGTACVNDGTWHQFTVAVTPGDTYTLWLSNTDNSGNSTNPTVTYFDDVALS